MNGSKMAARKTKKTVQRKKAFAPREPRSNWFLGIPLLGLSILAVVAMVDFIPEQSPVIQKGGSVDPNIGGALGMWIAYGVFWAFGLVGWLVPVLFLRVAWMNLSRNAQKMGPGLVVASFFFVAAVAGLTATGDAFAAAENAKSAEGGGLLEIFSGRESPPIPRYAFEGDGGAIGSVLTHPSLMKVIGPAGVVLVLLVMLLTSSYFAFREAVVDGFVKAKRSLEILRENRARRLAEQARIEAEAEAEEEQAAVTRRIAPPPDALRPIIGKEGEERSLASRKSAVAGEPIVPGEDSVDEDGAPGPLLANAGKGKTRTGFLLSRKSESEKTKPAPPPGRKKPAPPLPKADMPSIIEQAKVEHVDLDIPDKRGDYVFPRLELLAEAPPSALRQDPEEYSETMVRLVKTLEQFKVQTVPGEIHTGPVITRYEVTPAPGVRVEKIASLDKNIALALKALAVRILAPVPGKGTVGIEVPNPRSQPVFLREIIESAAWAKARAEIPVVLGKDVTGNPIVEDLTRMPHMLIAGSTGSGKTVCINTVIASLLFHAGPDDLRFIMVDPKVVEMQQYNDLPHMLIPVVTEPKKVPGALKYLISEMERRYQIFAEANVRNIAGFNAKIAKDREEQQRAVELERELSASMSPEERTAASGIEVRRDRNVHLETPDRKLPYIVCIIDELADLMMVAPQDIETGIARLAQLARAAGIHLILATQRPSVNVITGVIKANLPTRISFKVASKVDSRTILDQGGAEALIGKGDMLYVPPGASATVRAQGAFVSDDEINRIVDYLKSHNAPPEFDEAVQAQVEASGEDDTGESSEGGDGGDADLLKQALQVIKTTKRASTSSIQRRLKIGYNRAARIMDQLEDRGIVGPDNGSKPRELLVDPDSL